MKAVTFYHTPEQEQEKVAQELFGYERMSFKFIYAILGLYYNSTYKQVRDGKKRIRVVDTLNIKPLPNATKCLSIKTD